MAQPLPGLALCEPTLLNNRHQGLCGGVWLGGPPPPLSVPGCVGVSSTYCVFPTTFVSHCRWHRRRLFEYQPVADGFASVRTVDPRDGGAAVPCVRRPRRVGPDAAPAPLLAQKRREALKRARGALLLSLLRRLGTHTTYGLRPRAMIPLTPVIRSSPLTSCPIPKAGLPQQQGYPCILGSKMFPSASGLQRPDLRHTQIRA